MLNSRSSCLYKRQHLDRFGRLRNGHESWKPWYYIPSPLRREGYDSSAEHVEFI